MKKLGVIVIHGQGSATKGYASEHIKEVNERMDRAGVDTTEVAWRPVLWADLLGPREDRYYENMTARNDVDYKRLRRFMITAFGDAAAYRPSRPGRTGIYEQIHERVAEAVAELAEEVEEGRPLVFIGYSLGSQILSNFIWDTQRTPPAGSTAFQRLETLCGIITFGSTIPLFTFAHDPVKAIQFPPKGLSSDLQKRAQWLNFYDPDDALGYPLKALGGEYDQVVTKDVPINVGGPLSSWNPLAHLDYWTDDSFTRPVAKFLGGLAG